jgi:hypothetical protein
VASRRVVRDFFLHRRMTDLSGIFSFINGVAPKKPTGLKITAIKIDPYINIDAGKMRPTEHGKIFLYQLNNCLERIKG